MAVKHSVAVRNAKVAAYEATIGTSPRFKVYTGAPPTNTTDAPTGTLLVDIPLPSDWLGTPSGGSATKAGTWPATAAVGAGNAGYYRIYDSTSTTCHEQGTVTITGGGGDATIDNPAITIGQMITANSFTIAGGNA